MKNTQNTGIPLERFLHWEAAQAKTVYFTQPFPDGSVVEYTWAEVGDQARRMASYLLSLDLPAGSHIALLGKNSAHWIMADLAIWMAGHVSVPLYPTLNAETTQYVLEHSGACLLFIGKMDGVSDGWNSMHPAIPDSLPQITLPMAPRNDLPTWDSIIADNQPLQQVKLPTPDTLATIIYTSGSTGMPKGVMHSHGSMAAACAAMHDTFAMNPQDRMLSYLPLAHAAERAIVEINSFNCGFQVFFSNSLETFAVDLRRARPTVFFSVPRLWTKFYQGVSAKMPEKKLARLLMIPLLSRVIRKKILTQLGLQDARVTVTGSAPLPPNIIQWFRQLGLEMLDGYGMSENFAASHFSRPGKVRIGYVGSPVLGVQARIADNGELEVKSAAQMLGYYKLPEKTQEEMTADGYFKTGDRGEIDAQGRLKITGRVKDLFKTSKGKYVAPVPIEQLLGRHSSLEAVCVVGSGQAQPLALVMLAPDAQSSLQDATAKMDLEIALKDLLDSVNQELDPHEKLDCVVVVREPWTMDNGFLTPTMKIRRNVIEDRYMDKAEAWVARKQPVIWL